MSLTLTKCADEAHCVIVADSSRNIYQHKNSTAWLAELARDKADMLRKVKPASYRSDATTAIDSLVTAIGTAMA